MVQTVLGGAQGAADVGHVVDGVLDGVQRSGGAVLTADIQTVNTNSGGVAVINGHIQLVESIASVANLESQATTVDSSSSSLDSQRISTTRGNIKAGLLGNHRCQIFGSLLCVRTKYNGNIFAERTDISTVHCIRKFFAIHSKDSIICICTIKGSRGRRVMSVRSLCLSSSQGNSGTGGPSPDHSCCSISSQAGAISACGLGFKGQASSIVVSSNLKFIRQRGFRQLLTHSRIEVGSRYTSTSKVSNGILCARVPN